MNLSKVFSFCQWRILDHCSPAIRVTQTGIPNSIKEIIPSINSRNRPIEGFV